MRPSVRLSAAVKQGSGRFLEAGNPTGLTGLLTHPSPRPTLIYVYSLTLDRLKQIPESSVYRQSCEAVTKHRLRIVDDVKPAGWAEWRGRAMEKIKNNPDMLTPSASRHVYGRIGGRAFVETAPEQEKDDVEWDGEKGIATLEGTRTPEEVYINYRAMTEKKPDLGDPLSWEPEPPLDSSQCVLMLGECSDLAIADRAHRINDIEQQIGAGLIEEVLQVAEGELELVSTMAESKV